MTLTANTASLALIVGVASFVISIATAQAETIQVYEQRIQEINDSNQEIDQKIEQTTKLIQLWEAQQKLRSMMVQPSKTEKVTQSAQTQSTPNTSVSFSQPIGWDMDTVFVSQIFKTGQDVTADLYVNGDPVTIDVLDAIKKKQRIGSYIVVKLASDVLTFKNTKTKEYIVRRPISTEQIVNKINHNNSLYQQYQEKYAIGILDANIERLSNGEKTIPVSYPKAFDSMTAN